jgi:hypothetical protein
MRAQTDVIERAEWQLNESPELALKPREHGAQLLPPLPFFALQFHRVGIAPIGGDGTAWPMRQQLPGSRIDKVKTKSSGEASARAKFCQDLG